MTMPGAESVTNEIGLSEAASQNAVLARDYRRLGRESQRVPADISAYIREQRLTDLSAAHSTRRAIYTVTLYVSLAAIGLWADQLAVWCAVWVVMGFSMIGGAAGMHEGVHGLLYKTRWLNDLAASFWAAILLLPFETYRRFHLAHHRSVSTPEDPEPRMPFTNVFQYAFVMLLASPVFVGLMWTFGVRTVIGRPPAFLRTQTARRGVTINLGLLGVWLAFLIVATTLWPDTLLRLFWVPWQFAMVFVTMATTAEHYGCKPGPASAFVTTRTTTSNALLCWFFWNSNYHGVHHLHPGVPSHRLPQLHEHVKQRFEHVEPSYLGWHGRMVARLLRRR
ncbi:MAG TPA: fatty acid desaturase [Polyangiales bacterium]|nr:fatty acid desaturase [Polyangiales bacterium]